jgi:cholesterol transport system auxiliary component
MRLPIVFVLLLAAAILGACRLPGEPRFREATFDFGLPPPPVVTEVIRGSVLVPDVASPEWLDSPGIVYRLSYDEAARTRIYSRSRWAAPPAALVTQRLRAAVATATGGQLVMPQDAARADWVLRVDLEAFSQVFGAPDQSRAHVRMRATLIRATDRTVVAQRTFSTDRPAPSPDAAGGAKALAEGVNEVVDAIVAWAAEQTRR